MINEEFDGIVRLQPTEEEKLKLILTDLEFAQRMLANTAFDMTDDELDRYQQRTVDLVKEMRARTHELIDFLLPEKQS